MIARRVARPRVVREIPLDRNVVIEASAGTGKTFTLEHLVVELLLTTNVGLERILVVTFTEKATHEIRARVRAKLEDLVSGGGQDATDSQLASGDYWTIDATARDKLARALHAFDSATIATIHAFCQRILRENAFTSGLLFEEQQVDGREAFGRAFRDALRQDLAARPQPAAWLEAALAAGWSITRVENLLWECAAAHSPLRPQFDLATLGAALGNFSADDARDPSLAQQLKAWGTNLGSGKAIARRLVLLADAVAHAGPSIPRFVAKADGRALDELRVKLDKVSIRPGRLARVLESAAQIAAATPPFAAALAQTLLPPVLASLDRTKRQAGRYDFDDMLGLVDRALSGPRGVALAEAMRRRFRHAFIDEFQDTDEAQWSIFRRAFFDRVGAEPPSLMVMVGDPKQSIYRFRGADVETYFAARDQIVASGGARVRLESNHRATGALVESLNAIFDGAAPDPIFSGRVAYCPVECGQPNRALCDGDGQRLSPVHVLRFRGELALPALGAAIAREVKRMIDPERPYRLDGRALRLNDAFVLTRTAREGHIIGNALREAGIPHAFYKEEGLFQTDEANDIRALLAAIEAPDDRARRLSAWLSPFFGLPLSDVERVRDLPNTHPLVARLETWNAFAVERDFDRLFESIARDSGIIRREIFFADSERSLTNYLHLLEVLQERARTGNKTLAELVVELSALRAQSRLPVDLEGNVQRLESERPAVQIMTIHKAKGLEAPVVFVAGGLSSPPGDDVRVYHEGSQRLAWVGSLSSEVEPAVKQGEREEEQRLMYVALTRAMGRVYLPCIVDTANRRFRGPYAVVSRRISELLAGGQPSFSIEDVGEAVPEGSLAGTGARDGHSNDPTLSAWTPLTSLLQHKSDAARYARLRQSHSGALATSYTRMKALGAARAGERGEPRSDKEAGAVAPGGTLPGARATGIFLHELLERISLPSLAGSSAFDVWRARAEVVRLIDEAMAVHRMPPTTREHAERLVWAAYKTPVSLPTGERIDGFASAERNAREMEFVFPTASPPVPALAHAAAPRLAAAVLRGSLDFAFEHAGLTYLVDWKSDSLASYGTDSVGRYAAEHYDDQLKIYALAMVKLLGIDEERAYAARFGGMAFCFLRGFDGEGRGLWFARPPFDALLTFGEALRSGRAFGQGRLS